MKTMAAMPMHRPYFGSAETTQVAAATMQNLHNLLKTHPDGFETETGSVYPESDDDCVPVIALLMLIAGGQSQARITLKDDGTVHHAHRCDDGASWQKMPLASAGTLATNFIGSMEPDKIKPRFQGRQGAWLRDQTVN